MTLTKKSNLKAAVWAGGTTTQLAIFPETSEYTKFNFDYRISYATVEAEESTFTFMPGVTRHLMILKGSLEIDHIDRYQKQLNKFDTDVFFGEWPTKAKGRVTDFNLMTKGNAEGKLEAAFLQKGIEKEITLSQNEHQGIYLISGILQVQHEAKKISMNEGDFILLSQNAKCILTADENCEVVFAKATLHK